MRERKSAKDERIDDGELRGHAGDAERENEDSEKAKRLFLEENAETNPDILAEGIEDHMAELGWSWRALQ
jgi:hypothetical protein